MRRAYRPLVIAAALLGAGEARAQAPDLAGAQALFDDAKHLMAQGRFADACPKFLASYKLEPKPGAMVNLADCYERNGQTASAWLRYIEAALLAQRAEQADRKKYAQEHADALEPKLSRLTIAAPKAEAGLEVLRDGNAVNPLLWGTAVPIDPGKHKVEARAPGKKPWSTTVEIGAVAARAQVEVPTLEDASMAPAGGEAPSLDKQEGGLGAQRTAGLLVGIAGLAGIGVGSAFGVMAANKWSLAKNDHCGGTTKCDAAGVLLAREAKSAGTGSTILFVAGGALLVAGVVVFVTVPKRKSAPAAGLWIGPSMGSDGAGLSAQGAF